MKIARTLLAALGTAVCCTPVWSDARLAVLIDALRITEVAGLMRREGLNYAQDLNDEMLNGQGGAFWQTQVDQIYNPERMVETVRAGLEAGLSRSQTDTASAFFDSTEGQRIVELENAARAAMQDETIEEAARESCVARSDQDAPHLSLIDTFIQINDLIERNVAGALGSNYQFYSGLIDGGSAVMSEDDILREVYGQQAEIRADVDTWLCGYLLLAYRPLPIDELDTYVDFYKSPTGTALNAALFDGYETMYRDIAYALGRAVALNASGDDI